MNFPLILKIRTRNQHDPVTLHFYCHIADQLSPMALFGERLGRESRFYGENGRKMADLLKSIVKSQACWLLYYLNHDFPQELRPRIKKIST